MNKIKIQSSKIERRVPRSFLALLALLATCFLISSCNKTDSAGSQQGSIPVGAAQVDITPDYPVRLCGYGGRKTWNEGIEQKLWARALVIGDKNPVVAVTVDSIAVPSSIAEAAAKQIQEKFGITRERLVLAGTHSHTAPHPARDYLPTLYSVPLTEEEWKTVDRYSEQMLQGIVTAVSNAMKSRTPCELSWTKGEVGFAMNRRKMENGKWKGFGEQLDGVVDHDLPLIAARDENGKVVAMLVNYACHCTTLPGTYNRVCGDWAGYAADAMERDQEGAVGLVMIGCGADANPVNRGELSVAKEHGSELAKEVKRLLGTVMTPIGILPEAKFQFVDLPLEAAPERASIEKKASNTNQEGQLAQLLLKQLDAGEQLETIVSLPVQTWCFGDELGMVFIGGEVVVDYSLKLKQLYGAEKMWISAYCNDVPCYIPSARILKEGGYEAVSSMIYYGKPASFKPEVEPTLLNAISEMLPKDWRK